MIGCDRVCSIDVAAITPGECPMDWPLDRWLSDKKNAAKDYFGGAEPVPSPARGPDDESYNPLPYVRHS